MLRCIAAVWAILAILQSPGLSAQEPDAELLDAVSADRRASTAIGYRVEVTAGGPLSTLIQTGCDAFSVWRVTLIPGSHATPVLIGRMGGRLVRLGGFQSVDLFDIAECLDSPASRAAAHSERALWLARMADPNGDAEVHPAAADSVEAARARPAPAPRDTFALVPTGSFSRLTVLSRADLMWELITYVFEFDTRGHLAGWVRRIWN